MDCVPPLVVQASPFPFLRDLSQLVTPPDLDIVSHLTGVIGKIFTESLLSISVSEEEDPP